MVLRWWHPYWISSNLTLPLRLCFLAGPLLTCARNLRRYLAGQTEPLAAGGSGLARLLAPRFGTLSGQLSGDVSDMGAPVQVATTGERGGGVRRGRGVSAVAAEFVVLVFLVKESGDVWVIKC